MTMSPTCCAHLESVLLCFHLKRRSQLDNVGWNKVERALLPARCPRLRTLHVKFNSRRLVVTEEEVRERLTVLTSGGVVNLVVSNSS
jgi:hypothetical protein